MEFMLPLSIVVPLNIHPWLVQLNNTDGSSWGGGSPGHARSWGIFRDHSGGIVGCFSSYIGIKSALSAEVLASLLALEIAKEKGWTNIWLEWLNSGYLGF